MYTNFCKILYFIFIWCSQCFFIGIINTYTFDYLLFNIETIYYINSMHIYFQFICEPWDYGFERVPLVITASLARSVLPLSTRAFYSHLVSLNAAIFRVWRLTRRICLLDHLSFVCLASSSVPLRTYAIFPINQFRLASIPEPHSLASAVLSTFKHIPEQSFAFVVTN